MRNPKAVPEWKEVLSKYRSEILGKGLPGVSEISGINFGL